jgi:hypothetical protein
MKQWWHPSWTGILYTIVGAYLLIRHRSEADRAIEWASQANWRVLFGGEPRPLRPFSVVLIRALTILAGGAGLTLGLLSLIGSSSCFTK